MKDKTLVWIILYLLGVIAVVLVVRFGVTWYFGAGVEDNVERRDSGAPEEAMQAEGAFKYFIHRRDNPAASIYTVRGHTSSEIVEENGMLTGTFFISADRQKRNIKYTVKGSSGLYVLGSHWQGFSEYPKSVQELTAKQIANRIPPGTFIQLRLTTQDFPDDQKIRLINALENVAKGEWNFENLTLPAFGIEVTD